MTCHDCNGTGEFVHEWGDGTGAVSECPTCQGTGRTEATDKPTEVTG